MKVGFRKRSYKKSWSAITSGRYKRMMKRAANPFYGRKGVGFLKNPSKALRNAVYRRTTIGLAPSDISRAFRSSKKKSASSLPNKRRVVKKDSAKPARLIELEREKTEAQERMAAKYHLPSNARTKHCNIEEGNNINSHNLISGLTRNHSDKKSKTIFRALVACLLLLLILWPISGTPTNRQDGADENTHNNGPYIKDYNDTPKDNVEKTDDEDSSKMSTNTSSAESSNDTDSTDDNLIEGSKYDPQCKRAISTKYGMGVRDIHYTGTQSEDKTISSDKYRMTSTLNYGTTYKGQSSWVCYLFVYTDGGITTVIYDL